MLLPDEKLLADEIIPHPLPPRIPPRRENDAEERITPPPLAEQRPGLARIEELTTRIHEARTLRQQAATEADLLAHAAIDAMDNRLGNATGLVRLAEVCRTMKDGDHNIPTFADDGVRFTAL